MSDANPYSAPDAALDTGQDVLYQPKIFSFSGRIGRMRYLAYGIGLNILLMAVMIPLGGVTAGMGGEAGMSMLGMVMVGLLYIATIAISIMFAKRRLNDLNRSGWWFLLFLVPIVNLLMAIYLVFFPGSDGDNNFGPAPTSNSVGVLIPLGGVTAGMGGEAGMSMLGMVMVGLFYIATIAISIMFAKRRLNDLNRSGWWFLLFLVPIVNLLMAIYLVFFPGSDGDNNFGPAPTSNSVGVLILGWMMPVFFIVGIGAAILVPQFAAV